MMLSTNACALLWYGTVVLFQILLVFFLQLLDDLLAVVGFLHTEHFSVI